MNGYLNDKNFVILSLTDRRYHRPSHFDFNAQTLSNFRKVTELGITSVESIKVRII